MNFSICNAGITPMRPLLVAALLLMAVLAVPLTAGSALCADEDFVARGVVFQGRDTLMIETDAGEIFALTGKDLGQYVEKTVTVAGSLRETADGGVILNVDHALADDETVTEDTDPGALKQAQ